MTDAADEYRKSPKVLFHCIWISIVFSAHPSLETIYISYPISWGLTALLSFIAGEKTLRRMEKAQA